MFQLADKIPSAAAHVKEQCASVQGRSGSIVIQRRATKEKGQVMQTAACRHGFQSGLATMLVTQQRLHGFDRLNIPVQGDQRGWFLLPSRILPFMGHT